MIERHANSWQCPYLLQRRWIGTEEFPTGTCFKYDKASHGVEKKTAFHLNCCQYPVQTMDRQDTEELISLLY